MNRDIHFQRLYLPPPVLNIATTPSSLVVGSLDVAATPTSLIVYTFDTDLSRKGGDDAMQEFRQDSGLGCEEPHSRRV